MIWADDGATAARLDKYQSLLAFTPSASPCLTSETYKPPLFQSDTGES
jgi:hypothetical protein